MEILTILVFGGIALAVLAVFAVVAALVKFTFKLVLLPLKVIGFIAVALLAAILIPLAIVALPVTLAVGAVLLVLGGLAAIAWAGCSLLAAVF